MVGHPGEFWKNAAINLEELLRRGSIKEKHLQCTDLETFIQDCVDHSASLSLKKHMGLDHATCAVSVVGSGLYDSSIRLQ